MADERTWKVLLEDYEVFQKQKNGCLKVVLKP